MKNFGIILLTGVVMLAMGMGISQLFSILAPSIQAEYTNASIFRSWSDPKMSFYWFVPFITAAIMLFVWNLCKNKIKGSNSINKGFNFGLMYWAIALPGMIMSYSSFQLSFTLVLSWTLSNLFEYIAAGWVYARWRS